MPQATIKKNKRIFIIAEAGVNHNGSLRMAKELIDAAKEAGADAVKFQAFRTEDCVLAGAMKSAYQRKATTNKESLFMMLKKLELDRKDHARLSYHARKRGIMFLSTPFDKKSADMLDELGVPFFKIASGDITNLPFLGYVARKKRPIILSTGRSTLSEVREAVDSIVRAGNRKITILHCVSVYPAPFKDLNLAAIKTLKRYFGLPVGFSDHSPGIAASIAAVALGAEVIEKHFTLDRNLPGPDHGASLEPKELRQLIASIRDVEVALGNGEKKPARSERWGIKNVRKGLVANVDIPKGMVIQDYMISVKRPAKGIEPKYLNRIIGKTASRSIKKDMAISRGMIKDAR